jgi:hypothetical protein
MVVDLVPGQNQTKEFEYKSGSTQIDAGKEFTKPLLRKSLRTQRALWIEGEDKKALLHFFQ